jgi:DNA-binding IclR family transcriptional regulator
LSSQDLLRIARGLELTARTNNTITTFETLAKDLRATRNRGYAIDNEEDVIGVFCIGASFFDSSGKCFGAISATGFKEDLPIKSVPALGKLLISHADQLSANLGFKTNREKRMAWVL